MSFQDYELPSIESIDLSALTEKIGALAEAAGAIDPREIEAVSQWARSFTTNRPDEHLARCRLLDLTSRYVNGIHDVKKI
jgi:hypothetical protein